jgi:glycyl-tRNA synthetase beta subunit
LKLVDPDGDWAEWTIEDRIEALEEFGDEIEVFREKSAKEKKIEQYLKKQTNNMKPIEAMLFRDNYLKQLQEKGEKQTPDLENALTEKLMNTYLQD